MLVKFRRKLELRRAYCGAPIHRAHRFVIKLAGFLEAVNFVLAFDHTNQTKKIAAIEKLRLWQRFPEIIFDLLRHAFVVPGHRAPA